MRAEFPIPEGVRTARNAPKFVSVGLTTSRGREGREKRKQSWPKTDLAGEEWEEKGRRGRTEVRWEGGSAITNNCRSLEGEIRLVNFLIKQAADSAAPPASH